MLLRNLNRVKAVSIFRIFHSSSHPADPSISRSFDSDTGSAAEPTHRNPDRSGGLCCFIPAS